MRKRFDVNPNLNLTPIEKIKLPLKSRDELPPGLLHEPKNVTNELNLI